MSRIAAFAAVVVLSMATACRDDEPDRSATCEQLQPVADRLARVAAEADPGPINLDGPTWDDFQQALAVADEEARDGDDPIITRAVYRAREQAARADAVGRKADHEQFRVHLVESAAAFDDAVDRCRRFSHRVVWPGMDEFD